MKAWRWGLVIVVAVGSLAGCMSPTGLGLFQRMQKKAGAINSHGGLAAVGVGKSEDLSLATKMATSRGRIEVANSLQTRVNALVKDFQDQIGQVESAEFNEMFSSAGKQITSQMVQGVVTKEIQTEKQGKVITVYALMYQSPKAIKDYFANPANAPANLYTRFRASQAFGELEKDIQKFDAFVKQDMAPAPETK